MNTVKANPVADAKNGSVVTFYSFKGGVGRSMALANIGVLLARSGKSVLCVDWDLEAPGLDRYFKASNRSDSNKSAKIATPQKKGGLLTILEKSTPRRLVRWKDYVYTRTGSDGSKLDFIISGEDEERYSSKLSSFSWADFFAMRKGGEVIELLRKDWKSAYDFILIDSRTGLTDSSGICTIQMPDLVVLLFAANEQNIDWCQRIVSGIRGGRKRLPYDRAFLSIIPVLSRFDSREESDRADEALKRIAELFKPVFSDWLPRSVSARDMLAWSVLPYIPRYSFDEALAVEDEPETGAQGLSFYYRLLSHLIDCRLQKVREVLANVGVPGAVLPPLLPDLKELDQQLRLDQSSVENYVKIIRERAEHDSVQAVAALETLSATCVSVSRYNDAESVLTEAINIVGEPAVANLQEAARLKRKRANLISSYGGSRKRFRVAFSFAEEKRNFVAKVAHILGRHFGEDKILYDKFHEAEFANVDLAFDLPTLYKGNSDLIVTVFCNDFEKKEWCGLEWRAIPSIIKEGGSKQVLLARFDHADGKGLRGLGGFIELDKKTPEVFVSLVLQRLALNEGLTKDHYANPAPIASATPKTSIPHNLPRLQSFFGREEELRRIAAALDPEDRTWGALIDGPGGMGKTSLAVRAAYDASPEQFTRIVFVSLKSRELDDDGLRDLSGFLVSGLAELFNELARELGHSEIAKAVEDQRSRLLLESLRDTRTLLVLDNLESLTQPERGQIFNFVKRLPQGCKAILTSRGRIGSGAEELILEKLDQDAALQTLAELAKRNPALAKTSEAERIVLYTQTGGKPLLLRWTAGQIGRGSCRTFTDAIAYIRSCPPGNDPLEFIFGDLVADFSVAETQALCALTYFNLPAKVEHLAVVAEVPQTELEPALKSMANRSLAVPNEESQTYTLVPLVADFLRKKKSAVVAETGDRLEQRAYALVVENGDEEYDRFSILEAAWPTLAAALPRFLVGKNERLQRVCRALGHFLEFTGRWDEWLAFERDAEACAESAGDFLNAGWRAQQIGWVHYLRGQFVDVLICANRAEAHWQQAPVGAHEKAAAIRLRGLGHQLAKDYSAAIAAFREAVALWRTLAAEDANVAIGLNSLANVEMDNADFASAERDYREALRIAQAIDGKQIVASVTGNLAVLALKRENWSDAEAFARKALRLSMKVGRKELIAEHNLRLANALIRQDKKTEALPHAQRAVELYAVLNTSELARAQATLQECEGT